MQEQPGASAVKLSTAPRAIALGCPCKVCHAYHHPFSVAMALSHLSKAGTWL